MAESYRDPLAAAHARIAQLEKENALLRRRRDGEPASAAELEEARLENELLRVEMEWEGKRTKLGELDEARRRRGVGLVYAAFGGLALVGTLLSIAEKGTINPVVFCVFWGMAIAVLAVVLASERRYRRARVEYVAKRRAIEARLGAVRVSDEGGARVRVGESEEVEIEERAEVAPRRTRAAGG